MVIGGQRLLTESRLYLTCYPLPIYPLQLFPPPRPCLPPCPTLPSGQDAARKHIATFFSSSLHFRAILDEFDVQVGLWGGGGKLQELGWGEG